MTDTPTLIIFAEDHCAGSVWSGGNLPSSAALQDFQDAALATLHLALQSGLPIRFVARAPLTDKAKAFLQSADIVEMDRGFYRSSYALKRGPVSAGVLASAQSAGWLLVPADMPKIRPETLQAMGKALKDHPLVHPVYQCQQARLWGFSSEFFSELVRVDQFNELGRLLARYPSVGIDIDDPGLLPHPPALVHRASPQLSRGYTEH